MLVAIEVSEQVEDHLEDLDDVDVQCERSKGIVIDIKLVLAMVASYNKLGVVDKVQTEKNKTGAGDEDANLGNIGEEESKERSS